MTSFVADGLVLIIARGESVISIGVGAAGEPVTLKLTAAAVLTLALIAALWWSYFAQDEQRAPTPGLRQPPDDPLRRLGRWPMASRPARDALCRHAGVGRARAIEYF